MKRLKAKPGQTVAYLLLLIAAVVLMATARRCGGSDLPLVRHGASEGDTIDVGLLYGPMSYYVYDDTLGGLNYDLLRQMQKDIGRPLKFWPVVSLEDAFQKLDDGTLEILASVPSDNSIKQRFNTTRSAFLDRLVLVQCPDSSGNLKVRSALDLGPDTIHIAKGSPAYSRLANLSGEIGQPIPVKVHDDLSEEYLCMMVATGRLPLAVVNEKTAVHMSGTYPALSFDNPVSFTQFQVWLVAPGDSALLHTVDSWLESFSGTEKYRSLIKRY